ncbi:hypothetical protein OEG84_19650 [Hoeflea sp. G2-23]|uniref:Uncharacterized protein n=1 Tax=Hoeflea algicola TaxID=2983763 RepID=A0ABT3ZDX8_9HYPH|nr:hypothetical protein [Hoeflea algicola]MCY0149853.1 hypothetical protein [Hoeflea algicola]
MHITDKTAAIADWVLLKSTRALSRQTKVTKVLSAMEAFHAIHGLDNCAHISAFFQLARTFVVNGDDISVVASES